MEMPCICECGVCFDLDDGHKSLHSNVVICEECHEIEEKEKRIEDIEEEIAQLEEDIEFNLGQIDELKGENLFKEDEKEVLEDELNDLLKIK